MGGINDRRDRAVLQPITTCFHSVQVFKVEGCNDDDTHWKIESAGTHAHINSCP